MAAFNTPVNLNFGVPGRKQVASACFLLSISDTMVGENGITSWWNKEALIFKGGAGSGINVSNLRASMEPLSTGGVASGPCAYMRTADSGAGTIKSGGAHRRAAKMVCIDVDHPDIREFIWLKTREDERMRALSAAGFDLDPTTAEGEKLIAECTSCQNANFSIRVSTSFMKAVKQDTDWPLVARKDGRVISVVKARELFREIADAAWRCADPGILFHDIINAWHTTPEKGPITTCNPCAETHLNDDSSCNLASVNIVKFLTGKSFNIPEFEHTVDVMTTAMDITCAFSDLPTEKITENTRKLRQLGLGYANLGAALMILGRPYDSDEGRAFASSVTALLTGRVYRRSAELARELGPFEECGSNEASMKHVLDNHLTAVNGLSLKDELSFVIGDAALKAWNEAKKIGDEYGYRNAQATVIAPTGTISFMMGCDTTGAEPAMGLISYKGLAAGGSIKMINGSVEPALRGLGYSKAQIDVTMNHLRLHDQLTGVRTEHLPVFATALGENTISPEGHVKMLAVIQPFISGATSKTVNLPEDATVEDIEEIYRLTYRLGIKAIAIYREGSKSTSVLSTKKSLAEDVTEVLGAAGIEVPELIDDQVEEPMDYSPIGGRNRLPAERRSITHKFSIDGYEGYITAGMYPDGALGEIFLTDIGKEGSTLRGMMGAWATAVSIALQYGVPLETYARKFSHMRFEPEGATANPEIRTARSLVDYIMRWLISRFGDEDLCEEFGVLTPAVKKRLVARLDGNSEESQGPIAASSVPTNGHRKHQPELSAPMCGECGNLMQRAGTCYTCACGNSTGCG
jgi:ribonucleoside-diphosphate reductase alpha chain